MNYIFIYFLPGAAGNFFSRCLNLLGNSYCWVDTTTKRVPQTPREKIQLLNYESQIFKSFGTRHWVNDFESRVTAYYKFYPHWELPADANLIWLAHPDLDTHSAGLAGDDDRTFYFIIDSSDEFEWTLMNALYKNSYLDVKWLVMMEKIKLKDEVHKISLKNIISGEAGFFQEFSKVCSVIGHSINQEESDAVRKLYNQWQCTTLKSQDIPAFKKQIGFHW